MAADSTKAIAANTTKPALAGPGSTQTVIVPDGPKVVVALKPLFLTNGTRWSGDHPIDGATIELVGSSLGPFTTNSLGQATLKLDAKAIGEQTLKITPAAGEDSTDVAGPAMGAVDNPTQWLLRPFEVKVVFTQTGFDTKKPPVINLTIKPNAPAYALIEGVTANTLTIDWRPDFLRAFTRRARGAKAKVSCLVLHHTGNSTIGSALNSFVALENRKTHKAGTAAHPYGTPKGQPGKLTAHYLVNPDGHVVKLAHEDEETDHAGASCWQGEKGVNGFSIGIEIVHEPHTATDTYIESKSYASEDYPAAQYASIIRLVKELRAKYPLITRQRVVGHGDIAVAGGYKSFQLGRKGFEPDVHFDWKRLEDAGQCRKPIASTPVTPPVYGLAGPGKKHVAGSLKKGPHFVELKKDLFAIGFSVAATHITAASQITADDYDAEVSKAVIAFENRYCSGSRASQVGWPAYGHLRYETAVLIKQVLADDKA